MIELVAEVEELEMLMEFLLIPILSTEVLKVIELMLIVLALHLMWLKQMMEV